MKKCLLVFVFVGFTMLCTSVFAQSSADSKAARIFSVDDAVDYALKNNVSVERNLITLEAAKRAKNISWNSISPTASVGANASAPVEALCDPDPKYDFRYGITASVSMTLTPNLYASVQAAKIKYEQGKISFDEALRSVELSVRTAFYGLLYEKENITLQEKNLEIAQNQYNNNRTKYNQGRMSEIDVLSAEVNYKSMIPVVETAKTTYHNDLESFKNLLGLELDEEIEFKGNLDDELTLDEIALDMDSVNSSEIKQLELSIKTARNSVLASRFSAYGPSVNAGWNFGDTWTELKSDGRSEEKTSSVSLSVSIPLDGLLPWSVRAENIRLAKDSQKDYELQLKNAKKTFKLSIDSSLRSIKQRQASIVSNQANVKLASRSYSMTQEAYNHGTKDLLTLQNASKSLLSAQVALKSEIYALIKEILNLEKTIGVPFGTLSSARGGTIEQEFK